jgi:hypothetical protein
MTDIKSYEDFLYDWEWYAVDLNGCIASFTSGGLRPLPSSIRQDREAVESLRRYFCDEAPVVATWIGQPGVEDLYQFPDAQARARYVPGFGKIASKGLFAYDTEVDRSDLARYFLIARPDKALTINTLPEHIRAAILRTRAALSFADSVSIPSRVTLDW